MKKRGYATMPVSRKGGKANVSIRTSAPVKSAVQSILEDLTVFEATKLHQFMEAAYEQGRKDGARHAFELLDKSIADVKKAVPHINPGRPKKLSSSSSGQKASKTKRKRTAE